jgi:hypothetical protein
MAVDSPDSVVVGGRQNWSLPKVRVPADDLAPSRQRWLKFSRKSRHR